MTNRRANLSPYDLSWCLLVTSFPALLFGCTDERIISAYPAHFGGVGIELKVDRERHTVMSVIAGGSAHRAGIKIGHVILGVDGRSLKGLTLPQAVAVLRGKPGSSLTLALDRGKRGRVEKRLKRGLFSRTVRAGSRELSANEYKLLRTPAR